MSFKGWNKIRISNDFGNSVEAICPVVISASRSTDIPGFYSEWFMDRLSKGYLKWKNPFNQTEQYIAFDKTRVIVFWTKNAAPVMPYLDWIDKKGINYYFQFTVNDYESEGFEPKVPPLIERIQTFKSLSNLIGKDRVIWRFDPLLLTENLGVKELLEKIERVGELLHPYTSKLVFSFADIAIYQKVQNSLKRAGVKYCEFDDSKMDTIAEGLSLLKQKWGIEAATCGEVKKLEKYGIIHNKCIDDKLMVKLFSHDQTLMNFLGYEKTLYGEKIKINLKDKGQRKECGCIISKDIGVYNTCGHHCIYCYANTSEKIVSANIDRHKCDSDCIV